MSEPATIEQLMAAVTDVRARQEEHVLRNDSQHQELQRDLLDMQKASAAVQSSMQAGLGVAREERDMLRKILVGNGSPGALERLRRVEDFAAEWKRLVRWVIFGVLAVFGTMAWDVVVFYIESKK